jgi:hypothetical protein
MRNLRSTSALVLLFALTCSAGIQAATIWGTAPKITYLAGLSGSDLDALNLIIQTEFDKAIQEAADSIAPYHDQRQLARGFADANAFASQGATDRGYQNYSLFSVTCGVMVGGQAPSLSNKYYENFDARIKKDGDLNAGAGAGISLINVGVNAKFLLPGLYLNVKYGSADINVEEIDLSVSTFGITGNYILAKPRGAALGLLKWRGLSIGSGVLCNKTNATFNLKIDPITEQFVFDQSGTRVTGDIVVDPSLALGLSMETVTIPAEIVTSVRLLWILNLTLGAGIDFNFGKSDIVLGAHESTNLSNVQVNGAPAPQAVTEPGDVTLDGSTLGTKPSSTRTRLMSGIGLNLGPLKVDVPVTYYPTNGFSGGVTVGIVW